MKACVCKFVLVEEKGNKSVRLLYNIDDGILSNIQKSSKNISPAAAAAGFCVTQYYSYEAVMSLNMAC